MMDREHEAMLRGILRNQRLIMLALAGLHSNPGRNSYLLRERVMAMERQWPDWICPPSERIVDFGMIDGARADSRVIT